MKKLLAVIPVCLMLAVSGCGSKDKSKTDDKSESKVDDKDSKPVSVAQAVTDTGQKSPATSMVDKKLSVDMEPKTICEKFLVAIRNQDKIALFRLLTNRARQQIRLAAVEMQNPGGARATCTVTNTQYNSSKKDVAIVRCFVQEPVGGTTETSEFSYLLKRREVGWRISGMWIPIDSEGNMDLLSFENSDDVAEIKAMAGDSPTTVADNSSTQLK